MASAQDVSHLVMRKPSQKLNSSVKIMLLEKSLKVHHTVPVSSDDEVNVLELGKDLRNDWNQKVNSFSILQPRNEYDVYLIWISRLFDVSITDFKVRGEPVEVNSIWDGEGSVWVKLSSQDKVVLACVTYADCGVEVSEGPLDQFVDMDCRELFIGEE